MGFDVQRSHDAAVRPECSQLEPAQDGEVRHGRNPQDHPRSFVFSAEAAAAKRRIAIVWSMSQDARGRPIGLSRFHTAGVPLNQRVPLWELNNAAGLVGIRARPQGAGPLAAAAAKLTMPQITLARIRGTAHSVERDSDQIVKQPTHGVVVYFALEGRGRFLHRTGAVDVGPGQGVAADADQVFTRHFPEGLDALLLTIPREALHPGAGLSRPEIFDFRADTGTAPALARLLSSSISQAMSGGFLEWERLEARILPLVGEVLDTAAVPVSHAETALRFIAGNAQDPALSADRIAAATGISRRQLARVLAQAGTTIPRAVLSQRLKAARGILADPMLSALSMGEVAEASGFGSPEQFSRSYRQSFGVPPLRHRRELLDGRRSRVAEPDRQ